MIYWSSIRNGKLSVKQANISATSLNKMFSEVTVYEIYPGITKSPQNTLTRVRKDYEFQK